VKDMRGFIEEFCKKHPTQLIEINDEVDTEYEVTAIQMELNRSGLDPIMLFKKVRGGDIPLVTNLYGGRSRLAFALDTDQQHLTQEFMNREKQRIMPTYCDMAPVQQVVFKGESVNLFSLPVIKAHEADAAPYVTGAIAIAHNPSTGTRNTSFNRLMVVDRDTVYTHLGPGRHLAYYFAQAEERGESLPVTFSIGTHPAWALGALSLIPADEDELEVMGGIAGEAVRLARAITVEADCLADAEIVIEGLILPGKRADEGPYCEFTGYATGVRKRQIVKITAITMRKDGIYHHITAGAAEHLVVGAVPREARLFEVARSVAPVVKGVHIPESGCGRFHCYVSMKKIFQGQAKNVGMALLGTDFFLKLVVIVDEDIDVYDERQVLWAVATRTQAGRDTCIISEALGSDLDPSSTIDGVGSKLIIDATAKPSLSQYSVRAAIPEHVFSAIKRLGIFKS
jgi:2,5-furandicarboxylate decarboxylase 1